MIFNEEKLAQLKRADEHLDEKYGKIGTETRNEFEAKAQAWYFGEILKEERQKKHITQLELAERIGKERSYIAKVEQGKTDLRLSSFLQIINALNLSLSIN